MTPSQNILALIHEVAILFPVFLILFSFRGFFMTWVASLLGDYTARRKGSLSLNPFVHIRVLRLAILMVILYCVVGLFDSNFPRTFLLLMFLGNANRWQKKIPAREGTFHHPRAYSILYSFASAVSFLVMGFVGFACIRIFNIDALPHYVFVSIAQYLHNLVNLTLLFAALNLVPLPPFDASRILYTIFPRSCHTFIDKMHTYNFLIVFAILLVPSISHMFWAGITALQIMFKTAFVSILF